MHLDEADIFGQQVFGCGDNRIGIVSRQPPNPADIHVDGAILSRDLPFSLQFFHGWPIPGPLPIMPGMDRRAEQVAANEVAHRRLNERIEDSYESHSVEFPMDVVCE